MLFKRVWKRKVGKLQLIVKYTNEQCYNFFDNFRYSNFSDIVEALRDFYPEKDGVYIGIVKRFLANPKFLKLAYVLAQKKGSVSIFRGNLKQSILGQFSNDWFQKVAFDVLCGNYKIKANRTMFVCSKNFFRFLSVNDFKDKIIKKAMQLVLEEIYERKENFFSRFSHGFHFKKSCHSAFKQLRNE